MVELLRYLESNGFSSYIASGGDRDFMRPMAEELYGIPPERVIGSALGLTFDESGGQAGLLYKSKIEFFDDGPEKPVRIWSRLGRRPIVAVGNSNGDAQMLRFAQTAERDGLRMLVLHDDADRESDYVQGAEDALAEARDARLDARLDARATGPRSSTTPDHRPPIRPPAPPRSTDMTDEAKQPNILVIWGDDIGITNLSCYSRRPDGLPDAEHRPAGQGGDEVHRLLRRAELHRRPGRVHLRPERVPHRA